MAHQWDSAGTRRFGTPGATPALGQDEITAFNVIGYDLVQQQTVPEPGTLALLGTSLLGLAALRRRQRPVVWRQVVAEPPGRRAV